MKVKKSLLFPLILAFFVVVPFVYAASSATFLPSAQKFINNTCSVKNASKDQLISLYCYLFYKSQEQDVTLSNHETRITSLETKVTPLPGQISSLQSRVSSDEAEITTLENIVNNLETNQSPQPTDFVFFNNQQIPLNGFVDSQTFDAKGYSKVVFTYKCNAGATDGTSVTVLVSPDQTTTVPQYNATPDQCVQGGTVTLDTGGRYYSVEIDNNTNVVNPRPTVNVLGHFE